MEKPKPTPPRPITIPRNDFYLINDVLVAAATKKQIINPSIHIHSKTLPQTCYIHLFHIPVQQVNKVTI